MFNAPVYIIIPIAGMLLGGVMAVAGMYFSHQRQRLWHETARLALEKGQPLPPLGDERHERGRSGDELNRHDLRGGLVMIAVGAGIYFFLGAVADQRVAWLGAIPGFIGIALLLHSLLMRLAPAEKNNPPPRA